MEPKQLLKDFHTDSENHAAWISLSIFHTQQIFFFFTRDFSVRTAMTQWIVHEAMPKNMDNLFFEIPLLNL